MAGEINFGLIDTSLPGKIAGSFQAGQQEAQQNALQALALQSKQLELQQTQQGINDQNAIKRILGMPDFDPKSAASKAQLFAASPKAAQEYYKNQADLDKTNAETTAKQVEAATKRIDAAGQVFGYVRSNPTPDNANAALDYLGSIGIYTPDQVTAHKAKVAANPEQIPMMADMAFRAAMAAKDQLPVLKETNLHDRVVTTSYDQLTGKPIAVVNTQDIGQSPDNKATIAAENARNAANIRKDYAVAGLNPDGTPGGDVDTTARAIAEGKLPPPSGMALMAPRNQRILARVIELNPNYDFTDVTAKKKAASDFTSGPLGNMMRSNYTAGEHLDQLWQLADALNNRDTQLFNRLGNAYATQTGAPAPTNFDAVKNVVSAEVMKAIVANGGGVAEREELAKTINAAQSPAQLKGVIQQYRNLMSAQYQNLLQQRRAAGLRDDTLPQYNGGGAAPTGGQSGFKILGVR